VDKDIEYTIYLNQILFCYAEDTQRKRGGYTGRKCKEIIRVSTASLRIHSGTRKQKNGLMSNIEPKKYGCEIFLSNPEDIANLNFCGSIVRHSAVLLLVLKRYENEIGSADLKLFLLHRGYTEGTRWIRRGKYYLCDCAVVLRKVFNLLFLNLRFKIPTLT
jgi:hypothetical protein